MYCWNTPHNTLWQSRILASLECPADQDHLFTRVNLLVNKIVTTMDCWLNFNFAGMQCNASLMKRNHNNGFTLLLLSERQQWFIYLFVFSYLYVYFFFYDFCHVFSPSRYENIYKVKSHNLNEFESIKHFTLHFWHSGKIIQ